MHSSCKTDVFQRTFTIYNIQYVTTTLATLFNFAHEVLYLRCLVYYSNLLFFSFLILSCSLMLLFIIFKCTIQVCSLHVMTWIYYDHYYLSVDVILAKQKNTVFSKGTILSLVYLCVLFPFRLSFCFMLGFAGCEITETTQLYYLGCHMTILAGC